MAEEQSKFRNSGKGVVGVVKLDLDGRPKGKAVYPGDFVWLTEYEQILTANAPRNESDNPFTNGSLTLEVRGSEMRTTRPIGDEQDPAAPPQPPAQPEELREEIVEEQAPAAEPPPPPQTGAGEQPQGDPPQGQRAENEEVADEDKKTDGADGTDTSRMSAGRSEVAPPPADAAGGSDGPAKAKPPIPPAKPPKPPSSR